MRIGLWLASMNLIHKDMTLLTKIRFLFWAYIHIFMVPNLYAFAFVHCILISEIGFAELLQKDKDEFYNLKK